MTLPFLCYRGAEGSRREAEGVTGNGFFDSPSASLGVAQNDKGSSRPVASILAVVIRRFGRG